MQIWRLRPVAHQNDTRWQDHPIWKEVVVRAESAAMARVLAGRMEEEQEAGAPPTGNESVSVDNAFDDIGLYQAEPLGPEEARAFGTDGPAEVLRAEKLRERRRW